MRIVTPRGVFDKTTPDSEHSYEQAIKANVGHIFGEDRYYIDCKRRIGRGKKFNIPDAYLLDLKRNEPRLFVVENELAEHDLFKHIGVQLLEFSHSYGQAGRQVKTILYEEISKMPDIMEACQKYSKDKGYRNLDNLLDYLVFETPFQAIVIIDEETDELHSVIRQFRFPVEIIEFVILEDGKGHKAFEFNPFLQDVSEVITKAGTETADIGELDTIIVPAREDGFNETFLGENRWYAIRIHSSMIPQIKHIAAYRVAPISAITHVAPVNKIIPWKDTGKYCIEFAEPAHEINPIKLDQPGRGMAPQAPRYTSFEKLSRAKVWSDVF
ncbi:MAG: hypothetical protein ACTSV7_14375 [Candidatus Baldrarchaeia archaeon]